MLPGHLLRQRQAQAAAFGASGYQRQEDAFGEIVDDGRGVPEELAEQVFLPLVSGRAEGTGLGLALAQQVAREHRGSIAFRSRPGHTVFTVLLPLPAQEQADG